MAMDIVAIVIVLLGVAGFGLMLWHDPLAMGMLVFFCIAGAFASFIVAFGWAVERLIGH